MLIEYAVFSTVGTCRPINEDNYYLDGKIKKKNLANFMSRNHSRNDHSLFAVCDGLGGEAAGEDASYIAVSLLKKYNNTFGEDYLTYLNETNKVIKSEHSAEKGRRACTFAGVYFSGNKAKIVNLGDSRVYLFRDGCLRQLSKDHSEFQTLVDFGIFSKEDYYTSNKRNILTRCLGQGDETIEPYVGEEGIKEDDLFLLCSDGFCGSVREDEIARLLTAKQSLITKCDTMVKKALELKSDDNITVMLIWLKRCSK